MIVKNQRNSGLAAGAAKNIVQTACIAVLGVTFAAAWGGVPATSAGGERPQADAAVTAESTLGECLEIDVQKGYSGGIFGHKGDQPAHHHRRIRPQRQIGLHQQWQHGGMGCQCG